MFRKYQKTMILTSLLILLPIPVQLALGREWRAIMFLPLGLLAGQWFSMYWTLKDPGNQNQNPKPMRTVLWILPILSNLCSAIDYAFASNQAFSFSSVLFLFLGLMFAAIGNYLPKVKMNSTLGIKIPWAYTSEENWNATHRFGGKAWFCGGILVALGGFLPGKWSFYVVFISIMVLVFLPMIYSYRYYRMQKARGDALRPLIPTANSKAEKLSLIFAAAVLIFVGVMMFTGDIDYRFENDYLFIEADFYDDQILYYDVIDSVTYRDSNVEGSRVWGFGSGRLLMGNFQNEEFGNYTRYTYTKPGAAIILTHKGKTWVLSGKTADETQDLYQELLERTK